MPDRRTVLLAAAGVTAAAFDNACAQPGGAPMLLDLQQRFPFSWNGPLGGATQSLASRLGYSAWITMASGLPMPYPAPVVNVSVSLASATAAEIVVALERQAKNRAVVVLDPANRFIGVVYYG